MEISVATSYKNGKALGPGAVPIELMKAAPAILLQFLNCLTYNFLDNQYQHTLKKVLSAISYKCTYLTKCTRITLPTSIGRIYGKILKIKVELDMYESEDQSSFRTEH